MEHQVDRTRNNIRAQVIKGINKAQLVEMAMRNYTGTTRELQQRQYGRKTMLELALLVQERAYFTARGM